jgi:hypothetical protein
LDFERKWKSLSLALPNPKEDDEDITTINAESNEDDEYNSRGKHTCRNCILVCYPVLHKYNLYVDA